MTYRFLTAPIAAILIAAGSFSTPSAAGTTVTMENRGTVMTNAQIRAYLDTKDPRTIEMFDKKGTVVIEGPDRVVWTQEGEPQRVGKYRLDDSRFCMKYTELAESCYKFYRAKDKSVSVWAPNRAAGRFSIH